MIIKDLVRKRRLRKDSCQEPGRFMALGDIRTAIVLVDATGEDVDGCTEAVEAFFKKQGISLTLKYVDLRKFNSKVRPVTDLSKTITRRDLNWYGKPKTEKVVSLTEEPADLFVCICRSESYCIKYLSSCAKAKFKIGRMGYEGDSYSMVVSPPADTDDKEGSRVNVKELFISISKYLQSVRME